MGGAPLCPILTGDSPQGIRGPLGLPDQSTNDARKANMRILRTQTTPHEPQRESRSPEVQALFEEEKYVLWMINRGLAMMAVPYDETSYVPRCPARRPNPRPTHAVHRCDCRHPADRRPRRVGRRGAVRKRHRTTERYQATAREGPRRAHDARVARGWGYHALPGGSADRCRWSGIDGRHRGWRRPDANTTDAIDR